MSITIEAIYEHGSLKLLQPIPLAEGTRVEVIVVSADRQPGSLLPKAILAKIAAMPLEGKREPFSGRQHDQVLYPERFSSC